MVDALDSKSCVLWTCRFESDHRYFPAIKWKEVVLLLLGFIFWSTSASAQWELLNTTPWKVEGKIRKGEDLSGAVLLSPGSGLMVSDETRGAQRFSLVTEQLLIRAGEPVPLADGKGKELDLEAVAVSLDGRSCYLTGSHGVSRKDGSEKPERMKVFQLVLGEEGSLGRPKETSLVPVLQRVPELALALGQPPEKNGLDIEALAERDGALFFGMRSPCKAGQAYVLEVMADQLFSLPEKAAFRLHTLALGEGCGLRDMLWTGEGFLLISGPSAEQAGGYQLHWWADGKLSLVAALPSSEGKAEALCMLSQTSETLSLLLLCDGLPDGGPLQLSLSRRR
jgi:hypothetical protein